MAKIFFDFFRQRRLFAFLSARSSCFQGGIGLFRLRIALSPFTFFFSPLKRFKAFYKNLQ